MNAYSRGSQTPRWCGFCEAPHAGGHRAFCTQRGYSSVVEQQPHKLPVAGSTPAFQAKLSDKQ